MREGWVARAVEGSNGLLEGGAPWQVAAEWVEALCGEYPELGPWAGGARRGR